MAIIKQDGNFNTAAATEQPVYSAPIPRDPTKYIFTQEWMQNLDAFKPLPLNTPHPVYSDFILVAEGEPKPLGGGVAKWTRTYAMIPPSYDDPEMFSYNFIGMLQWFGSSANSVTRSRFTANVLSKVRHEFFLVDPDQGDNPGVNQYQSENNIPKVNAIHYCNQWVSGGNTFGGVWAAMDTIYPTTASQYSVPDSGTYAAMVQDARLHGWNATLSQIVIKTVTTLGIPTDIIDTTPSPVGTTWGGIIPVEDSRLVSWNGLIWDRQTRYILAQ